MARIKAIELPDGNTYEVGNKKIWYGTCATAASTAAKVVSCEGFTAAELDEGTIILITFSETNSGAVGSLTLNVNNTGAKKIQYINNGTRGNLSSAGYLKENTTYPFIYDGTYWLALINYNSNTTYAAMTESEMQTGTAVSARSITAERLKQAVEYHAPVTSVNGSTGAVTITVPTKTSDLTNDSGFITVDEKVKTDLIPSTSATYYLTLSSSDSSQTSTLLKASELSAYYNSGSMLKLILGKDNIAGRIRLYSAGTKYAELGINGSLTNNRTIYLPDAGGTIALTTDIPTVPTNVSAFTNDAGYLTSYTETDPVFSASAAHGISTSDITNWNGKQATLVSGTNIKTINNESLLGSGNISISSGLQNLVDGSATGSVRGIGSVAEDSSYTLGAYASAFGVSTRAGSSYSHAEGAGTNASSDAAHAEGQGTTASGAGAHAEGGGTTASGANSHAEGGGTVASGNYSHAEGNGATASGNFSHAEGSTTTASGLYSHAEGGSSVASNNCAHAEGVNTTASGAASHAQNYYTIAQRKSQTALGEYNIADTGGTDETTRGTYAVIVGNGTSAATRSNALTIDWSGNVDIASGAHYKINGTNLSASDVGAQPTLVSGTNIKTINNTSLLGSGNITTPYEFFVNGDTGTGTQTLGGEMYFTGGDFIDTTATDTNGESEITIGCNKSSLLNFFYPVGSYYETSLPSTINNHSYEDNNLTDEEIAFCGTLWFDPRVAWGGTWVKDSAGKVTVAQDTNDSDFSSIGNTGGEKTHTLTTSEIPAHTHGSKTLTASFRGRRQGNDYASHWAGTNTTVTQGSGTATSDAAGTTSKHQDVISFSMTHTHDSVGDGIAHENMPPYVIVNRWHRLA